MGVSKELGALFGDSVDCWVFQLEGLLSVTTIVWACGLALTLTRPYPSLHWQYFISCSTQSIELTFCKYICVVWVWVCVCVCVCVCERERCACYVYYQCAYFSPKLLAIACCVQADVMIFLKAVVSDTFLQDSSPSLCPIVTLTDTACSGPHWSHTVMWCLCTWRMSLLKQNYVRSPPSPPPPQHPFLWLLTEAALQEVVSVNTNEAMTNIFPGWAS